MSELRELILHRRAIRRFEERQIDEAALQQILEAGLYAPSAGGRQGVLFVVSQDKAVNERLGKIKRANSNPKMATATITRRRSPAKTDGCCGFENGGTTDGRTNLPEEIRICRSTGLCHGGSKRRAADT